MSDRVPQKRTPRTTEPIADEDSVAAKPPDEKAITIESSSPFEEHLQHRALLPLCFLTLSTMGLYGIYWFYSVNEQFNRAFEVDSKPALETAGVLLPTIQWAILWKHCRTATEYLDVERTRALFAVYFLFYPIGMCLVQRAINGRASAVE